MRILLLTGGLYILAVSPMAAQEASDSTKIFAVPATTPAAPNRQELFVGAALIGLGLGLVLRSGGSQPAAAFRCT